MICFRALARPKVIGRDIRVFEETTSTNDVIEKLARDGVKEGVVVFAESQTKGRGRLGRKWISPARKGLWFSVLLRPAMRPAAVTQLTIAAATALRRAIRAQTGLTPEIKWPNDILIRGKKVAGILTELSAELDQVKYVILGIGVDVNLGAGEFPPELRKIATSLKIETGQRQDRAGLGRENPAELDRDYERDLRGQIRSRCGRMGGALLHHRAATWPFTSATEKCRAARNRWMPTARCCCARSMAVWNASSAAM